MNHRNHFDSSENERPLTEVNPEAAQALGICDGIVAFFDILGFKNIVNNENIVVNSMKYRLFLTILKGIAGQVQTKTGRAPQFEWVWGTDSVLLYTRNNTPDDFEDLVLGCSFLISMSLAQLWPVRGAIAFGEFVADRQRLIFLGKPIVDAIEEEKYQEWIGGVLVTEPPSSCQSALQNLSRQRFLLQHDVPMKRRHPSIPRLLGHVILQGVFAEKQCSDILNRTSRQKWAIGWPMAMKISMAAFKPLAEEIGISAGGAKGRSLRKINNTIGFQNRFLSNPFDKFCKIPPPIDPRKSPFENSGKK